MHPWDALHALGMGAGFLAFAMAAFVYFLAPSRAPNRRLALVLFFEGMVQFAAGAWEALAHTAAESAGFERVFFFSLVALPPLYLLFLATLDTPLVRVLRPRSVQAALAVGAAALPPLAVLAFRFQFVGLADGPNLVATFASMGALAAAAVFGLVAALSAFRRTQPGTLARRRAKAYAIAFGTRDALMGGFLLALLLAEASGGVAAVRSIPEQAEYAPVLATLLFVLFMALGILRTQLFDIDVKIKWTVRQSTLAAVFIAVFYVVSEGAQQVLSEQVGPMLGIAAAALLVFALAPLQRLAQTVADATMPGVRSAQDLSAEERAGLFREQVRFAWSDGNLERAERLLLENLRERLGLSRDEAARIEAEVVRGAGA